MWGHCMTSTMDRGVASGGGHSQRPAVGYSKGMGVCCGS